MTTLQADFGNFVSSFDKQYEFLKDKINWDEIGRGCDGQLQHTESILDSANFSSQLDKVIGAAKSKLAPGLVKPSYLSGIS